MASPGGSLILPIQNLNDLPNPQLGYVVIAADESGVLKVKSDTGTVSIAGPQGPTGPGGVQNTLCCSNKSTIITGYSNYIGLSRYASILGSVNGTVSNSCYSSVIGGQNQTLYNTNNTVLVPSLIVSGSMSTRLAGITFSAISLTFSTGDGRVMTITNGIVTNVV